MGEITYTNRTYFRVLNADGINPNNLWERTPDGLYNMLGGPTGFALDQYELEMVTERVPCMKV
jgi:hypothetical protein